MTRTFRLVFLFLFLGMLAPAVWAQSITRGPYLQQQTDHSMIVHWRTNVATDSVVRFGTSSTNLNLISSDASSTTEHTVLVSGLSPSTEYFYSVGNSVGAIAGDATFHFATAPVPGTAASTRFWVIGDSGTANSNARAVRDAFKTWSASKPADFMLMLGDNAYNNGTDLEYQSAVFDTYPELLRQLPLWPTLGNHDGYSADSQTQTGPYYDIFDLPKNAEAGGLESFTEAYYSFDYGNIHFVVLDSYDSDRTPNGNMLQWLESDLAMNDKPWLIGVWHHPPYTKGSHDSDTEGGLIDMRQNALPILEAWGVDLVLSGHSHTYERSYLVDGHYGLSGSLDIDTNILDLGDGRESGDGAYQKPDIIGAEHEGAVYAVAGSSGKVSAGYPLNHPVMYISLESLGSMVLDVSGNRLDATFLDQNALVKDQFTILKTPDVEAPLIDSASAEDATHVLVDFSERVDVGSATDIVNFDITGLSIDSAELLVGNTTVRLTTSAMTAGAHYVMTVNNVMDESNNNIAANSQAGFDFNVLMTKSFQNGMAPDSGYNGTFDTYIREASASTNYASATTLQVDGDEPVGSTSDMSILLGWDISAIPSSATVQSATIYLNVVNVSSGPYFCYALLTPWQETQATWNEALTASAWALPGAEGAGDRDSLSVCTISVPVLGPASISLNNDGLALVQSWVDGSSPNYGIVIADSATTDGADFDSSDSANAMNRPKLEIVYTVPGTPGNTPPVAEFSQACIKLACDFNDLSSDSDGTVVGWLWDFGDGNGSAVQHPSHTYASASNYTVNLTVTDSDDATDNISHVVNVVANIPPSASFTHACTDLDCDFTDTSGDSDGSISAWLWNFGDGTTSSLRNPSHTYTAANTYTVNLTVTDDDAGTDNTFADIGVTEPPQFVDYAASGQISVSGSVNGSVADTQTDNGVSQSIEERQSGGKKQDRYSLLEHKWTFEIAPASGFTFNLNGWSSGSSDGDNFVFAWSTNDSSYSDFLTVSSTDPGNFQSAVLPNSLSGTVYIRVRDSDQTAGHQTLDRVYVDQMYIHAENAPGSPPAAPSGLQATTLSSSSIGLSWNDNSTDELGFDLQRSTNQSSWTGIPGVGVDTTATTDTGLLPSTTYYYRLRAYNLSGSSAWTTTTSAMTDAGPPPADITLTLSGSKNRGYHVIDLSWSGTTASSVEIYRDGGLLITVPDSGSYTDNTSNKGAGSYTYKVCETGTSNCSAVESIVF